MAKTSRDLERKALVQAYQMAGEDFLVVKVISKVFCKIETESDRIRHNDAINELNLLTEPDSVGFLRQVADLVFNGKGWKRLLKNIADVAIQTANRKRKDEK